jgi:opacity protein-like surface antigen
MQAMNPLWVVLLLTGAPPGDLPRTLAEEESGPPLFAAEEPQAPPPPAAFRGKAPPQASLFSLGLDGGYVRAHGADQGTWMAGIQARLHILPLLSVEAAVGYHKNSYFHGDSHVTQYPVQLSALITPLPNAQFSPYLVGGVGWYYSRIAYDGALSGLSNETENTYGTHAGAGLEFRLGRVASIDVDWRYILLHPRSSAFQSGDFNFWQATLGLNFFLF